MDSRIQDLIDARPPQASLDRVEGRLLLTMVRELPVDAAWLWAKVTDPAELARWSPIVPERPLTETGPVLSTESPGQDPVTADVEVVDAPNALVHRWGDHLVRWGVVDLGPTAQLGLQEAFDEPSEAPLYAAGWHVCLAVLEGLAQGLDVPRVVGADALAYGWEALRERYAEILGEPASTQGNVADLGPTPSGGGGGESW
ncbi:SRPBCC family protein [Mariniluteicoccus flavus]